MASENYSSVPEAWLATDTVPGGPWPGELVDSDTVAVQAPESVLLHPSADLHVLLVSRNGDPSSVPWAISKIYIISPPDADIPVAAVRLHGSTGVKTPFGSTPEGTREAPAVAPADQLATMHAALRAVPDVWAALEAGGVVPPGVRERVPGPELGAHPRIPVLQPGDQPAWERFRAGPTGGATAATSMISATGPTVGTGATGGIGQAGGTGQPGGIDEPGGIGEPGGPGGTDEPGQPPAGSGETQWAPFCCVCRWACPCDE